MFLAFVGFFSTLYCPQWHVQEVQLHATITEAAKTFAALSEMQMNINNTTTFQIYGLNSVLFQGLVTTVWLFSNFCFTYLLTDYS